MTLRNKLANESRMKVCALRSVECHGKLEWHHVWIHAGRQINEAWAIVALCKHHHKFVDIDVEIKREVARISLRLATDEDLAQYPRLDWKAFKNFLLSSP